MLSALSVHPGSIHSSTLVFPADPLHHQNDWQWRKRRTVGPTGGPCTACLEPGFITLGNDHENCTSNNSNCGYGGESGLDQSPLWDCPGGQWTSFDHALTHLCHLHTPFPILLHYCIVALHVCLCCSTALHATCQRSLPHCSACHMPINRLCY
jgi:hypothetical protein